MKFTNRPLDVRVSFLALAFVMCLGLFACADKAQQAQDRIKAGTAKAAQGDFTGAIADFDAAIAAQPDLAPAYYDRGSARDDKGDHDGAVADYSKAIELKPDLADAYFLRGKSLNNNADFAHAVADFSKVIELQPNSLDAYGYRAGAEINLGNLDGALADYNKAIEIKPGVAEIYSARGDLRFLKGDFAGALADYDQTFKLDANIFPMQRLYRHLLLARAGQANDDLAATVAAWKDGWAKTIGLFLSGKMNEKDFLAAADKGDPTGAGDRLCQADYFAGMKHLLDNDPTGARQLFRQSALIDGATVFERDLAKAEAARMDKAAGQ